MKAETNLYIQYKPLYLIYWFCLWPVWPLSLWFHFLIKVLSMWMLICCGQNQYYAMNVYVLYLSFKPLRLISLILFHDLVLVLVWYLITFLWMKASNQKITTKKFPCSFSCFEIVLACFLCSLGTISSTNIFGIIFGEGGAMISSLGGMTMIRSNFWWWTRAGHIFNNTSFTWRLHSMKEEPIGDFTNTGLK